VAQACEERTVLLALGTIHTIQSILARASNPPPINASDVQRDGLNNKEESADIEVLQPMRPPTTAGHHPSNDHDFPRPRSAPITRYAP
jgi:hypothetical protein